MEKPYAQVLIEANEGNRVPPEVLIYCLALSADKNLFVKEVRYEGFCEEINILTIIISIPLHREKLDILYSAEWTAGQYFPDLRYGFKIEKEDSPFLDALSDFDNYSRVNLGR